MFPVTNEQFYFHISTCLAKEFSKMSVTLAALGTYNANYLCLVKVLSKMANNVSSAFVD